MADPAETIIANDLVVTYHPSPPGLPHGIRFVFTEANGDRTAFFVPCKGEGQKDVGPGYRKLMKALDQLLFRKLDS